jgi:hypothetical protein
MAIEIFDAAGDRHSLKLDAPLVPASRGGAKN